MPCAAEWLPRPLHTERFAPLGTHWLGNSALPKVRNTGLPCNAYHRPLSGSCSSSFSRLGALPPCPAALLCMRRCYAYHNTTLLLEQPSLCLLAATQRGEGLQQTFCGTQLHFREGWLKFTHPCVTGKASQATRVSTLIGSKQPRQLVRAAMRVLLLLCCWGPDSLP
jgi:hypothetical protein